MKSIYIEARREELRFLEKHIRDVQSQDKVRLSREILSDWNRFYFWFWLSDKICEHFRGEIFWLELFEENFGKAKKQAEINDTVIEIGQLEYEIKDENLVNFKDKQDLISRWQMLINKLL